MISLSGTLFHHLPVNIVKERKKVNIFIGHGTKDTIIPIEIAEHLYKPIIKISHYHLYQNMTHAINKEELNDFSNFIELCINNTKNYK